jgi:anti-sigma factor RsiW
MNCSGYRDLVGADVDGDLSAEERAAIESHVPGCARCSDLRRAQEEIRTLVRARAARHTAPALLRERIVAALDREPGRARPATRAAPRPLRMVLGGALAASLAFALASLLWPSPPDLVAVLANDVHGAERSELALTMKTDDVDELRRFYRGRVDVPFELSVEDLKSVGFHVVGGRAGSIGGAPSTMTLYEGGLGKIVCRRFRAGAVPLPEGGESIGGTQVFETDGMTIRIARLANGVICVMASTMPREEFLRLFIRR